MRSKLGRLLLVGAFLGLGAFLFYDTLFSNSEQTVTFVLTEVELPGTTTLLRHEHVMRLDCTVLDMEGIPVATMYHKRPGAIATPAPMQLPHGKYRFSVKLTFEENGVQRSKHILREASLDGETVRIHL
ncbi:MAG: hypothetical protein ACI9WU_003705 [Myxococcota bacterium]|jgi:hypothetical protein